MPGGITKYEFALLAQEECEENLQLVLEDNKQLRDRVLQLEKRIAELETKYGFDCPNCGRWCPEGLYSCECGAVAYPLDEES